MTVQRGRTRPEPPWWTSVCIGSGSALIVLAGLGLAAVRTLT